jgi:hypothetical protein
MATPARKVPSPADAPQVTARQLIREIRRQDGRVFRMREVGVFVVTKNKELAQWLILLGGKPYLPKHMTPAYEYGSYRDAPGGPLKWDIYIHSISVRGEQSVWEAAADADADLWERNQLRGTLL